MYNRFEWEPILLPSRKSASSLIQLTMQTTQLTRSARLLCLCLLAAACGAPPIDDGVWDGRESIAGVEFILRFETRPDQTYRLTGSAGGLPVDDEGSFSWSGDDEITLTSGEFSGFRFQRDGTALHIHTDDGLLFMTLHRAD
jgi:hypothetical protein